MSQAAPDSAYVVRLPLFEGPLDLLLHLIEREELDITAISLAAVTDQFVAYLKGLSEVQPGVIADFLIVAARLILIKSRLLLPKPPAPGDDEDEEDPGEALVRRLRAYKRVKDAASWLRDLEQRSLRSYVRVAPPPSLEARLVPGDASLDELILALRGLFDQAVELEPVDSMVSQRKVTVREKIDLIETLIRTGEPVPFGHLLDDAGSRIEIVVSIWAVLEMIKRGRLQAHQSELFGEIVLVPPSNGK
jgi:segregation and condensation protein A